jgi:hypothetical protein
MKWREKHNREPWYTGPTEGTTIAYARGGGKTYRVRAAWRNWLDRSLGIVWWSGASDGTNKAWKTKAAAIAWCERDASAPQERTPDDA